MVISAVRTLKLDTALSTSGGSTAGKPSQSGSLFSICFPLVPPFPGSAPPERQLALPPSYQEREVRTLLDKTDDVLVRSAARLVKGLLGLSRALEQNAQQHKQLDEYRRAISASNDEAQNGSEPYSDYPLLVLLSDAASIAKRFSAINNVAK